MAARKWGSVCRRSWSAALAFAALVVGAGAAQAAGDPSTRIVGGSETTTEQWPWQVAVTKGGVFACGGTLIAADTVLTAAHCVEDLAGEPTPAGDLGAVLNLTDLSDDADPDAFTVAVEETFVAPQFDLTQLSRGYDFALLLLATGLTHETIDLATSADASRFGVRDRAWATGWGLIDGDPATPSPVLHEVDVRLADCSSSLGFSDLLFFCATGTDGICAGDSGGPLMIKVSGVYRQIGVSSFADRTCEHFSAWTNVADGPVRSAVEDGIDVLHGVAPAPSPAASAGGASDTAAPQTTITKAPKARVKTRRKRVGVTIAFTASETSDFRCSLDGRPARDCSSPHRVRVRKGRHRFEVFATDAAGNRDPTPARASWRVKRRR